MLRLTVLASVIVGLIGLWLLRSQPSGVDVAASGGLSAESWDLKRHLGGISPWRSYTHNDSLSSEIPSQCIVDQVHLMSRHAERYPTGPTGLRMLELFHRLKRLNTTLAGDMAFLDDWDFFAPYPAQQFEQLTLTGPHAGSLSAFAAGVALRGRYLSLLEAALRQTSKIRFWAGECDRVIDSARLFAHGFFGLKWEDIATLHIIPETTDRGADTLTPGRACPKYASDIEGHGYGHRKLDEFIASHYPKINQRLRKDNPELIFNEMEIFTMQEMCAFEVLVNGQSPWCDMFTTDDMLAFEYARDLLHYYRAGPGNKYGPALGWLWLNATSRLLQEGPDAGPLFLSFNHDGDIIAMMTALDLFPQEPHLPTDRVDTARAWRMSDIVPMGARFILERYVCPAPRECWHNGPLYPNHVYCKPSKNETLVRVMISDGYVPIPGCSDGTGGGCPLAEFIEKIAHRGRQVGDMTKICGVAPDAPQALTFLHQ